MLTWFIFTYFIIWYVNLHSYSGPELTGNRGSLRLSHASPGFIRITPVTKAHKAECLICIEIWSWTDGPGSNPMITPLTCFTGGKLLTLSEPHLEAD